MVERMASCEGCELGCVDPRSTRECDVFMRRVSSVGASWESGGLSPSEERSRAPICFSASTSPISALASLILLPSLRPRPPPWPPSTSSSSPSSSSHAPSGSSSTTSSQKPASPRRPSPLVRARQYGGSRDSTSSYMPSSWVRWIPNFNRSL